MDEIKKIRVLHYCKGCSLGGTEKTAEIFCRHLDPEKFEVHFAALISKPKPLEKIKATVMSLFGVDRYRQKLNDWNNANARVRNFERALTPGRVRLAHDWTGLRDQLLRVKPDILHVHYGGDAHSPIADLSFIQQIPAVVATHVFEKEDMSPGQRDVKKMLFVTRWLLNERATWAKSDPRSTVLYNPLEPPATTDNLRSQLGLPFNAFIVGRIGRPSAAIHHPISIEAYARIEQPGRTFFLALAPSQKMIADAKRLKLQGFIALPATVDEAVITRFYNTIDVLAHARKDGETFGLNIAEAMRHGKPVVTHRHAEINGHLEVIGDTGFVTDTNDVITYAEKLALLRDNPDLRLDMGQKAQDRAIAEFDAAMLTRQLEQIYLEALSLPAESP